MTHIPEISISFSSVSHRL